MTQISEVDKHYEMVVHQAHSLGLSGGGTPEEYDEVITHPLAVGRNLVAILAEPRSYKTHVHYSLRDMFARAASHAYFATRRQRATLDTTRDFEIAFGLGFDEGERIYSTPETARAATMPAEDPTAEQSNLMIAANLLIGMGHIDYGRAVRSLARRLSNPSPTQQAMQAAGEQR